MNKEKFLKSLSWGIRSLPKEERENAISFYEEYFNESEDEATAIAKLPHPKEIAANLLIEFGEKKQSLPKLTILFAVLAAPITLPLGMAGIAVIFAIVVTIVAVLISIYAIDFSVLLVGIVSLISIVPAFLYSVPTGFVFLGVALLSLSLSYLLWYGSAHITKKLLIFIKNISIKILKRRYKHDEK